VVAVCCHGALLQTVFTSHRGCAEEVGQFSHDRFAPFAELLLTSMNVPISVRDYFTAHFLTCQDVSFYFAKAVSTVAQRGVPEQPEVRTRSSVSGRLCPLHPCLNIACLLLKLQCSGEHLLQHA
jgi:hypothetical protein